MIGKPLPLVSVTKAQRRVLSYVADGMRHFDGMVSGRTHRRAHFEALEEAGLLRSFTCVRCDDDGLMLASGREGEAWALTDDGFRWMVENLPKNAWSLREVARKWRADAARRVVELDKEISRLDAIEKGGARD